MDLFVATVSKARIGREKNSSNDLIYLKVSKDVRNLFAFTARTNHLRLCSCNLIGWWFVGDEEIKIVFLFLTQLKQVMKVRLTFDWLVGSDFFSLQFPMVVWITTQFLCTNCATFLSAQHFTPSYFTLANTQSWCRPAHNKQKGLKGVNKTTGVVVLTMPIIRMMIVFDCTILRKIKQNKKNTTIIYHF